MATLQQIVADEYEKSKLVIAKRLQWYARRFHRYKHRTHQLKKSTVPVINPNSLTVGLKATMYYAPFVINGHGTWAPDPFLVNAMQKNRQFIRKQYQTVIARATRRYNAQNRRK